MSDLLSIQCIIADDEAGAREIMQAILTEYFPEITIMAVCDDLPSCIQAIRQHKPNLLFLDIDMPGHNGLEIFDFLNEDEINFEIIFVTAYSEYALRAFRLAAIDYLLKPIQIAQLEEAIVKFKKTWNSQSTLAQLQTLKRNISGNSPPRICIPSSEGKHFFQLDELIYLKADGAYSEIFTTRKGRIYVGKKLKYFEELLPPDSNFMRVHRSFLVNLNHVKLFSKANGGTLTMSNTHEVGIAHEKMKEVSEAINHRKN